MITLLRWLLLPISLIYQAIVWIRNRMYDKNILKSQSFPIPTIVIGNLAIGGAGKSPMTEYLIRFLKDKYTLATLSRGYGRKTKGFRLVQIDSTALEVGDEPLQFKKKFSDITVAVCEDRCFGVQQLAPSNDIILLDDAYQHRKLKAGYYILLFDFNSLFEPHLTLPTGNFRDNFSATGRADLVVITKTPAKATLPQKLHIESLIKKYSDAPLFYSSIQYELPKAFTGPNLDDEIKDADILLFCGIANPKPLVDYLISLGNKVQLIPFSDHHNYSHEDIEKIHSAFNAMNSDFKIILTTEKDIQRINKKDFEELPLYYIPISSKINKDDQKSFDDYITSYISHSLSVNKY